MTERRCHYATFIISTLKAVWAVLAAIVAIVIQSGTSEEVISEIGGYRFWIFIVLVAFCYLRFSNQFYSLAAGALSI